MTGRQTSPARDYPWRPGVSQGRRERPKPGSTEAVGRFRRAQSWADATAAGWLVAGAVDAGNVSAGVHGRARAPARRAAGPGGRARLVIDVDSFVGEVCGRLKQPPTATRIFWATARSSPPGRTRARRCASASGRGRRTRRRGSCASPPGRLALARRLHQRAQPHPHAPRRRLTAATLTDDESNRFPPTPARTPLPANTPIRFPQKRQTAPVAAITAPRRPAPRPSRRPPNFTSPTHPLGGSGSSGRARRTPATSSAPSGTAHRPPSCGRMPQRPAPAGAFRSAAARRRAR